MSIVDLHSSIFSPKDVIAHLKTNRPCVVRNFLSTENIQHYVNHINTTKIISYKIGTISSNYMKNTEIHKEKNEYLELYKNDPDLIQCDRIRIWKHNKNNLTPWHYDGNGTDLLNICLQGRKRFYLSPPLSFPVYPFTNVSIHYDFKEKYNVEIGPGDMLFLPAYWFHKVITLENNSLNINYALFNKHNNQFAPKRDQELYGLHNLFNTTMDPEILSLYKHVPLEKCILRGSIEMFHLVVLLCIVFAIAKLYKKVWIMPIVYYVLFMVGVYIYTNKNLDYDTCGMSKLYGIFTIYITIVFSILYFWLN